MCVSLRPVKVEKKRKDRTPSPSSLKIVIDLTAEEEYATFPLAQLSEKEPSIYVINEKERIVYEHDMYRSRAWAAPATPAKAPVSQYSSSIPSPFPQAAFEEQPKKEVKKEVQVKKEMLRYRCDYAIKKNAFGVQRSCDICHAVYSYVLCQAQVSSEVWFLGLRSLCHRHDWLPIDHQYLPILHVCRELTCSTMRESVSRICSA